MFCRKVLILLSAVCSLNASVPEPSRSASACKANLAVDTIENVIRGGGDFADGWGITRKQDEFDGSINCKQLISFRRNKSCSDKPAFIGFDWDVL